MHSDDYAPPTTARRLEWPEEDCAPAEASDALSRLQREFWSRIAPGILDTRCVDYQQPPLDWG